MRNVLLCLVAVSAIACGPSPEKIEAGRVLVAIDALRDSTAPANARMKLVDALAAVDATHDLAKNARDLCVAAYRPLLQASATMEDMKAKKEAGDLGPEIFEALKGADQAVAAARVALPKCETAQAALARAYR